MGLRSPSKKGDMRPFKAVSKTSQEFASNTTIHGITYIFDSALLYVERILWIFIVIGSASLGIYMSYDAYKTWQDDPMITTVSSTGLPLKNIEYPAITICSQGMVQAILDKALKKQFNDFLVANNHDPDTISDEARKELEDTFVTDKYPGAISSPDSLVNAMVSDNPDEAIKSKLITDPASACVDDYNCEAPWFELSSNSLATFPEYSEFCFALLENTDIHENYLCEDNGGQRLGFRKDSAGKDGMVLSQVLSEHSSVNISTFWYTAYLGYNNYILNDYDDSIITDLIEFPNPIDLDVFGLPVDNGEAYCITASVLPEQYGTFTYNIFECDDSRLAQNVCFKERVNCTAQIQQSSTTPAPGAGRRKRQADEWEGEWGDYGDEGGEGGIGGGGGGERKDPTLDMIFVPKKKKQLEQRTKQTRQAYKDNFKKMDLKKSYKSLFEILWYTQLPCFDVTNVTSDLAGQYGMIKKCTWKGRKVPCSKIFVTFPTDRGMCCTFNMKAADEIFMKSKYREMVEFMEERDKNMSFDHSQQLYEEWKTLGEPVPEAGRTKGLQLILDAHSDVVSGGTVSEDFDGFFAIIDGTDKYPNTQMRSVLIRPGYNNIVSMDAVKISAAKDVEASIEKEKRNCFFPTEKKLTYFKYYSQSNCKTECLLDFAASKMNKSDPCMPWYFPMDDNSTMRLCDPWEARDFLRYSRLTPPNLCDGCLPDCETTVFKASVTAAPFRRCDYKNLGTSELCNFDDTLSPPIWGQQVLSQYSAEADEIPDYISNSIITNLRRFADNDRASGNPVFTATNDESPTYDAYQKDIAMVTFFFESPTIMEYSRQVKMTLIGYISQMGGLLGLCLGFSLISLVEILYWFTIRMVKNM